MSLTTLINLFRPYRNLKIDTKGIIETTQKAADYALKIQLDNLRAAAFQYKHMNNGDLMDIKILSKEMEYLSLQQKLIDHLNEKYECGKQKDKE